MLRVNPVYHLPVLQAFLKQSLSAGVSVRGNGVWLSLLCIGLVVGMPHPAWSIVQHPSDSQIEEAMENGREGSRKKKPPTELYYRFGSLNNDAQPYGFLMTRLSGIAVLSAHFFLRGEQPSSQDIQRVLMGDALQVVVMIFGNSPAFAEDSYLMLQQQDRLVKPDRIRLDARASLVQHDQETPLYRAKIVASFLDGTFDGEAPTTITVFPGAGGKVTFDLDFSAVP